MISFLAIFFIFFSVFPLYPFLLNINKFHCSLTFSWFLLIRTLVGDWRREHAILGYLSWSLPCRDAMGWLILLIIGDLRSLWLDGLLHTAFLSARLRKRNNRSLGYPFSYIVSLYPVHTFINSPFLKHSIISNQVFYFIPTPRLTILLMM